MTLKRMKDYLVLCFAISLFGCVFIYSLLLFTTVNWWYIPCIKWSIRRSRANLQVIEKNELASSPNVP